MDGGSRGWWLAWIVVWRGLHWAFTTLGIFSTITAAAKPEFFSDTLIQVFSFLAVLSFVFVIAATPSRRANAFNRAYRHLVPACIEYELNPDFTVQQLLETYQQGEAILECTDPY